MTATFVSLAVMIVPGTISMFIKCLPDGQLNGFAKWTNKLSLNTQLERLI